jgi:hypothetical protein
MNKNSIKEKMIALQENIIGELKGQVDTIHTSVDIDEESTHDPEDYSHQFESQELEQLIKVQLNKTKRSLDFLKSIDFGPKNTATLGAIVKTNKTIFFIGFATMPFESEDGQIVGISLSSPIYPIMASKKTGDNFKFSGIEYTIENIY